VKTAKKRQSGIYVEILIRGSIDRVWQLTQEPDLHQRWDLRFHSIRYLPRENASLPQRFLYETRIGFGLSIKGTGETLGQKSSGNNETTSALKFASDDPKSLIREGSGYWRYVPTGDNIRFFTWYDYDVRFGALGRILDRIAFRPIIGWATAWSFDRLRLWVEGDQSPETSMLLAMVHAIARVTVAFIWIWHGLIPKLLFHSADELTMLRQANISLQWLPLVGVAEVAMGLLVLILWNSRIPLLLSALLMVFATAAVALRSPQFLTAAFNPVSLNLAVIALCVVGLIASRSIPSARHCLRKDPGGQR
jgi:uncharacterized membrane protein YphA (DoxX/SURF4 family)